MPVTILSKETLNRLQAINTGKKSPTHDETINEVLDTLQELITAQDSHLKFLRELKPKLQEATAKVNELKQYKVFVEWLDQHPELDKTEIIGLWVSRDYGQIALRYANFDFPEGFFLE